MYTRCLIPIFAVAALLGCHRQSPPLEVALQNALDESLAQSDVVGVSAAVLLPEGELWKGASGLSHEDAPVTTEMLFDIGSTQKNLQAVLCLALVEDGLLSLDDQLDRWFPPHPNLDGQITIRKLLNMTSGIDKFVDDPNSPFQIGYRNICYEHSYTWDEIYADHVGAPRFSPGTRCEYSSTNYIVLRHVIERVTGSHLPDLFEERIAKRYDLDHTLVDFSNPVPPGLQIAHGWLDVNEDGEPEDISDNSLNWIASLSPMLTYSTPGDMARWVHALFHTKTVLRPETVEAMLSFVGPVQNEPMMKGYGLGVVDFAFGTLLPRWEDVRVYGHAGSTFGYSTFVGYFPEYGVSIAIMFNRGCDRATDRAIGMVAGALFDVLLRRLGAEESNRQNSVAGMLKELEEKPDDIHLMFRIATRQREENEDYEASLMYEQILERDPENRYGYRLEAEYWKAIYDGVISKNPENLIAFISAHGDYSNIQFAYDMLARTYKRRGEMGKAVQVYKDALEAFGPDAEFYNHYAWWVFENSVEDEYNAAIDLTEAALAMKPDACHIWDTLAWLYLSIGEQDKAVEASRRALGLAPMDQQAEYGAALERIKAGGR